MALIKCKECKKKISSKAITCPTCGAPNEIDIGKKPNLKFWLIALGVLLLVGIVTPSDPTGEEQATNRETSDTIVSSKTTELEEYEPRLFDDEYTNKAADRSWLKSPDGINATVLHLMSDEALMLEQANRTLEDEATSTNPILAELYTIAPEAKQLGFNATKECLNMSEDEVDRRIGFRHPGRPFKLWVYTRIGLCKRMIKEQRWVPGNSQIPTGPPVDFFKNAIRFSVPTDTPGNRYFMVSRHRKDGLTKITSMRRSPKSEHPLYTRKLAKCDVMQIRTVRESRDWEGQSWFDFQQLPALETKFKTPIRDSITWFQLQYACGKLTP